MTCPICTKSKFTSRALASRENKIITIHQCLHCHHSFQDPENYVDIYSTGDFTQKARGTNPVPDKEKLKALDKKALARLSFYKKEIADWQHVLEIGSSIGSFLHLLKLEGKTVRGIEPDPDYSAFSKPQYHIDQDAVMLQDFESSEEFDAICSFHVIEHVSSPREFVTRIHHLLEPHGKILIECPSWEIHSFGSLKHTVWQPHLQYFTLASMYHLLSREFKVLKLGFLGIALYAYAEKSDHNTFNPSAYCQIKARSLRVNFWNRVFPRIKLGKGHLPLTTTQLFLQPILQKTVSETLHKIKTLGAFAPKEAWCRKREAGWLGKRALHLSYFSGWENAGDTVLSKCVRDSFRAIPQTSWRLRQVTAPVTAKLLHDINKSRFLLIGGGGLLLPDSNPNSKSGWQWAASKEDIDKIDVPIVVYAIGYNYFPGQQPNELFKKSLVHIVDRAAFFGLRNHGSIKAVESIIPASLHHKLQFQPCPTTLIRNLHPNLPAKVKSKNIAINVAYDRYDKRFGQDMYVILDQIALALKAIAQKGYVIYNVCHLKDDAKFEISLDKHQVPYKTVLLQFELPNKVYEIYNQMDLVLGLRGHAQMIPFGLNCKIISLGSHNKLRYFLEDINAEEWFVNLKVDPERIKERILDTFEAIYKDSEQVETRLLSQQRTLMNITTQNSQHIKNILKS